MSLIEWSFHAISEIFAEMYRIVTMKSRCRDDREREAWAGRVRKWHSRIDVYQTSLSNGEPDRWRVNFGWVSIYNVLTPRRRVARVFFLSQDKAFHSLFLYLLLLCSRYIYKQYATSYCERYIGEARWKMQAMRYVQTVRYCLDTFQLLDYEKPRGIPRLISTLRSRSTLGLNRFLYPIASLLFYGVEKVSRAQFGHVTAYRA